ncbi:pantoate--beta-alanine ligase [Belliella kenyensis]|uniref:Pantothenate synthetase n=1 Tax=Belliella kenyensis TaxID=1472724 RepID=A0ABV8EJB8_9BACT|nr:pantoate--beta-alanine ligase [Belliella kenyensis]MCH7403322.1 pantoate--beta-alanine ligase [Belliella kenyensis]MDN3602963.1 pantoate--beta-alanine ligase [Belliella kenyensis]
MEILRTKLDVKSRLNQVRNSQKIIGFVPTMGALHEGHLTLIDNAKLNSDLVIASIFVNPTQFNNKDDFEKYPITIEKDLDLLKQKGVDFVFLPAVEELYASKSIVKFDFGYLDKTLEGVFRPGHFSGVGLVVSKLLNIVKPHKSFFGQKDLQQVAVIKRLVEELEFDVRVITVPTVRELDGLAMSSRNVRLSIEGRAKSTILYQSLTFAKDELLAGKEWFIIQEQVKSNFQNISTCSLEYFELVDTNSLEPKNNLDKASGLSICIAAYVEDVRLIDNLEII